MGHWEQIGVENIRHRQRIEGMTPAQRRTREIALNTVAFGASIILWALILAPPILAIIHHLR
jgi:hypothetical protein